MSRILITGAAGFIGSRLASMLRTRHELFALVRPRTPRGEFPGVKWIEQDLARTLDRSFLPDRLDAVIHLAQSRHYREFPEQARDIFNVNIHGTFQLLEYARKVRVGTFILASSGGIYGHGDEGFREDQPISPKDGLGFYLGTKLCAEVLAENYTPHMSVIILRFFFVYGSGQSPTMLIPRLVKAVKEGRPITLNGEEGLKMNPTYVTDAGAAVCRCLELTESQKINIGGPEVLSLRQIGQQIGKNLHKDPTFEVKQDIPRQHLVGDITKMTILLGQPIVRFEEGITRYIGGEREG